MHKSLDQRLTKLESKRLTTDEICVVLAIGKDPAAVDAEIERKAAKLPPGQRIIIVDR